MAEENWYAVYTKPRKEPLVEQKFQEMKIKTFYPKLREKKRKGDEIIEKVKPLFPRYIFVFLSIEKLYYKAKFTHGVQYFVGHEQPIMVKEQVINYLQERLDIDNIHLQTKEDIKPGDEVEITDGVFQGLRGLFYEKSSKQRVKILLNILSSQAKLELDDFQVKKIE